MADQESSAGAVWRAMLSASAGAAAVFVLDRAFFKKDKQYLEHAVGLVERRVDRLEAMALRAKVRRDGLPPAVDDDTGVDRDAELFRRLAPDYDEVDFSDLEVDDEYEV